MTKKPAVRSFENRRIDWSAIASPTVKIDPVAVMTRKLQRSMSMHDQPGVRGPVVQKRITDPQQVVFGLLFQRDARLNARMNKQVRSPFQIKRQ